LVKESIKGNVVLKYKSNTCQSQKYITFYAKVTSFDFLNNALRAHVSIYTERIKFRLTMIVAKQINYEK